MTGRRGLWIFAAAILIFGTSIYLSSKRLKNLEIRPVEVASQDKPVVVEAPSAGQLPIPNSEVKTPSVPNPPPNCHSIPEFNLTKRELGRLVNQHELRQHNVPEFLKQINEFRLKKGIPLPLLVDQSKVDPMNIVYNRCHPSCKGSVNAVFVLSFMGGRDIQVLTTDGTIKKMAIHDSGLDVITIDELSTKGVPFRSWKVPVVDSGWYISGNYLYYPLDIEGAWLQADTRGNWNVVSKPAQLSQLVEIEPAVKLPGCTPDDHCLQIGRENPSGGTTVPVASGRPLRGQDGTGRHFKAPKACEPILMHSQDEPADEEDQPKQP